MLAALPFPNISPELFSVSLGGFDFALRWYALAYIGGIVIGWRIVVALIRRPTLWPKDRAPMTPEQVEALLTWMILGIILGGRIGFALFYQPHIYLADPLAILRLWEGGMAFHGGFLGVVLAAILFARNQNIPMLSLGDAVAVATPVGVFLGRIANFINAELWGRPSDAPWAVIFPGLAAQECPGPVGLVAEGAALACARHPSQLYEALLEGLVLGLAMLWLATRGGWLKAPGRMIGVFLAGYGAARVFVEAFRQADAQFITPENPLGHILRLGDMGGLTMGQLLSLPMLGLGVVILAWTMRRPA